jgi:hypothetical protein
LVKRDFPKKFFVKIGENGITQEVLMSLTELYCLHSCESEEYKTFEIIVHNQFFLKDLLLKSKCLINTMEIVDTVERTNTLYQQGLSLK